MISDISIWPAHQGLSIPSHILVGADSRYRYAIQREQNCGAPLHSKILPKTRLFTRRMIFPTSSWMLWHHCARQPVYSTESESMNAVMLSWLGEQKTDCEFLENTDSLGSARARLDFSPQYSALERYPSYGDAKPRNRNCSVRRRAITSASVGNSRSRGCQSLILSYHSYAENRLAQRQNECVGSKDVDEVPQRTLRFI